MIKWKKPNGTELETNEIKGNIEFAEAQGWKRVTEDIDELDNTDETDGPKKAPKKKATKG